MPTPVEFFFDPICPFAWMTSRWLERAAAPVGLDVRWRFLALALLNEGRDYATEFPPEYPMLHRRGLRMLRVAAAVRDRCGDRLVGPLYTAYGESIWNRRRAEVTGDDLFAGIGDPDHLRAALARAGVEVPAVNALAAAADDASWDDVLRADTAEARRRAGDDIGTPVVAVEPPDGPAFFGPVISRIPDEAEAVELWQAVMTLARWPGFAELKRSLRDMPQLPLLGA